MRIIAIGDTHGRADWKKFAEQECDKFIFIGDYFDSFDISGEKQIENFKDILQYKRDNMDKAILLIGNHDFHYLSMNERYSGFQKGLQYMIQELISKNLDIMQMCYMNDPYLFTHAGVTKTWLANMKYTGVEPLDVFINELFRCTPRVFCFTSGSKGDNYGNEICQTPIWVRPESLRADGLTDHVHIVGHTQQPNIGLSINNNIILIDVLGYTKEALLITEGNVSILKTDEKSK